MRAKRVCIGRDTLLQQATHFIHQTGSEMSLRAFIDSSVKFSTRGKECEDANACGAGWRLHASAGLCGHLRSRLKSDFKCALHSRPVALKKFHGRRRVKPAQQLV